MANHQAAWALLVSYVVLLALNSSGITLTLFIGGGPPNPEPPETEGLINVTEFEKENGVRYRSYQTPQVILDYAEASGNYADYMNDPRMYLILPCGVSILIIAPLVLGGLCSMKLFSTTVGLYNCAALWGLNLSGLIIFQNWYIKFADTVNYPTFMTILGIQIGMLITLSIQIILAICAMHQQKIKWPVIHFSRIFSLNTAFLVTRLVLVFMAFDWMQYSYIFRGIANHKYKEFFRYDDSWSYPKIQCPEYIMCPVAIAFLYSIIVSFEGLFSQLLGHLHGNMLSFTTTLSALFYVGVSIVSSPAFVKMFFSSVTYPDQMNWAIGLTFLFLVNAVLAIAKPTWLNAHPNFLSLLSSERQVPQWQISSDIRSGAATLRSKFKGSDTLLYNTILTVLSSLAVILSLCHEVWWWAGMVMVCGHVVILSRVLPIVLMETLTGKSENVPVLKILMHTLIECCLLLVGACGSFGWFREEMAVSILISLLLVILLVGKLINNPRVRAVAANLSEEEPCQQVSRQLINDDAQDESSIPSCHEDSESGGIYQPVA